MRATEILTYTLKKFQIPPNVVNEIVEMFSSYKEDIVYEAPPEPV